MHYYQFHIGDYRSATAHLTNEQDLAYRRLLDMYYDTESPIPNDPQNIARKLRVSIEDLHVALTDFFTPTDDGWTHHRCEKEVASYRKMSDGGRKGAAKRWHGDGIEGVIAPLSPPQPTPNANHKPITNNHKPSNTPPDGVSQSVWDDFVKQRKAKKAPVSDTVITKIRNQAEKAGWSLEDALAEICARGWTGFNAEWVKEKQTFAQQAADVARTTVPIAPNHDAALKAIEADLKRAVPMPANIREQINAVLKKA